MNKQLENIRKWLLIGGIGLLAVFVIAVMVFEPRERVQNEQRRENEQRRQLRQQGQQAEPAPIVLSEEERQRILSTTIEMVFVEGGTFTMGRTAEELPDNPIDVNFRSTPAHEVTISQSFYIGKYVITQGQWEAVMGTTIRQQEARARPPSGFGGIHGEGGNYPMYYVSWNEAQEFIRRLNAATGKKYRLPTEAEWEFAARGGNKSRGYKYSGSNNIDDVAWFNHNSSGSSPVGTKQPNELGIYDMSGNVREWVNDWYQFGYPSCAHRYNPTGPSSGSRRATRNASWWNHEYTIRVFFRFGLVPDSRNMWTGFRVARCM